MVIIFYPHYQRKFVDCILPVPVQDVEAPREVHPSIVALLQRPQPKPLHCGPPKAPTKNKKSAGGAAAGDMADVQPLGEVTFNAMWPGSFAVLYCAEEGESQPQGAFRVKMGNRLGPWVCLVSVIDRDATARSLTFQYWQPVKYTSSTSKSLHIDAACSKGSFKAPDCDGWRETHVFKTDEDIAGMTVGAWDPNEGDPPFPARQYQIVLENHPG